MKNKIRRVVNYLNEKFNQDSDEYCIFRGAKPQVIRFSEDIAISLWACGAIVCIGRGVYFISEDDGNWFAPEYLELDRINKPEDVEFWKKYAGIGYLTPISLAWGDSFMSAFKNLSDYVKENGKPYYYVIGRDDDGKEIYSTQVCGYELS